MLDASSSRFTVLPRFRIPSITGSSPLMTYLSENGAELLSAVEALCSSMYPDEALTFLATRHVYRDVR
jgi:hypothetical protein